MVANIYIYIYMNGNGDLAETDIDDVSNTFKRDGGKKGSVSRQDRRRLLKIRKGGSDPPEADFDSIFGREVSATGGFRTVSARKRSNRKKRSRRAKRSRKQKSAKRGGYSWSNVGVDRVRRSLQSGKIVETGRLKDYNVFDGAY